MDEAARKARNTERLGECFPPFAEVVRRVLDDMESQGFRPRIQDAWRSLEDQAKAKASGHSQVSFGFHNTVGAGGVKEALACDVLDDDNPMSPPHRYLLSLAITARRHGLETLCTMSLKQADRAKLESAIVGGNPDVDCPMGGDPTHIQPVGITTAQAKAGVRPTFGGAGPAGPGPAPVVVATSVEEVVVKSGDTLSKIAQTHGLTLAALLDLNPQFKANPNLIHVGDHVRLR